MKRSVPAALGNIRRTGWTPPYAELSKLVDPANLTGITAQLESRGLINSINRMAVKE
jgi:hypothetical protein